MEAHQRVIPPGPEESYKPAEDLLVWMGRQFETYGDTYKAFIYGANCLVTRNADFAYHILVENWQNYVKGQIIERVAVLLGSGLMVSEGELWKRQRRMIQPGFHPASVGALTSLITQVNSELLRKWQLAARRNKSINVTGDVSGMAIEVMLRFIFGADYELVGHHFELLSHEKTRDMAFARSFRALGKIILQLMEQRRENPLAATDALSMLMQARDPQTGQLMPDRQVVDEILTLIVAGHETTASTLNWAWYLLSQHPEIEQRLSDELNLGVSYELEDLPKFPYTRQIIDETMRLYPAGWLLTRRAMSEDFLGEYFVPAGTEIYVPPYFIQRHPLIWEDPDGFNPERFHPERSKQRHRLATLPFSTGPRNCIGSHLARVEMQIHLMTIARYLRLRYVQPKPIELDAGVNLRSKFDFIMFPEIKAARKSEVAAHSLDEPN